MTYRLSPDSLRAAIAHLSHYGDTDIFPHLPELSFFADEKDAVVAELVKLDLDTYTPAGAVEALAPKGRYSFRIAHQLPALDTLLLLACVQDPFFERIYQAARRVGWGHTTTYWRVGERT
jgi:O6-methylguanine-DNA--protein-cysteine methyltransferase